MLRTRFLACIGLTSMAAFGAAQVLPPDFTTAGLRWTLQQHTLPGGRVPFVADPVLESIAKDPLFYPDWSTVREADGESRVDHPFTRNGWAATRIPAETSGVVLLRGAGFAYGFLNGVPFVGDPYSHGYLRIPVYLQKGLNTLLLRCARGPFSLTFEEATGSCSLNLADTVVPDLIGREGEEVLGAVVILNHLPSPLQGAVLEVGDAKLFAKRRIPVPALMPLGMAKLPFRTQLLREAASGPLELPIVLKHSGHTASDKVVLNIRKPGEPYRVTRRSSMDASVQYYAVREPVALRPGDKAAVHFSLHGAGVEAIGQAAAHASKPNAYTVAPTNRRPFGFDWQEWGLFDALETLEHFLSSCRDADPNRTYLVGHSMGGHGTWYLGAVVPSLWAAIGPSAGWISFFTYGGGRRSSADQSGGPRAALEAAKRESDTLAILRNLETTPIFATHGSADDVVPVSEMRDMVAHLKEFHTDLRVYEHPGGGHWYDDPDRPGAECLDYPPRNEWFQNRARPSAPTSLRFSTFHPALSADHFWLRVVRQAQSGEISTVSAELMSDLKRVEVATQNVTALSLRLSSFFALPHPISLRIDDTRLAVADPNQAIHLERVGQRWRVVPSHNTAKKHPARSGPFKYGMARNMVWVYGTQGTPEENEACLAKVRFDRQAWWYRANGNVEVIPDTSFRPENYRGRNIVLYGHAEMNSAFAALTGESPIRVMRGMVRVGKREYVGDLTAFFVYPIPGTESDSVVVVGATSALALRRSFEPRYFTSGVSLPDYTICGPDVLVEGEAAVLESGYFGQDWSLHPDTDELTKPEPLSE